MYLKGWIDRLLAKMKEGRKQMSKNDNVAAMKYDISMVFGESRYRGR